MVEELMNEYGRAVYALCLRLEKNAFDADDLYQQTFLCAMGKHIDRERNVKALLMKICLNTYKSSLQKKIRRQKIAPSQPLEEQEYQVAAAVDVEEEVVKKEIHTVVREITDGLDEKYKIPILLYYGANLTCAEAANVLNLSEGTLKSRLHRGKGIIKSELEARGYE